MPLTEVFLSEPMIIVIDDERFTVVNPARNVQVPVWERPDWKAFSERHAHKFKEDWMSFFVQTRASRADWPMERFLFWKMCRARLEHVNEELEILFGARL